MFRCKCVSQKKEQVRWDTGRGWSGDRWESQKQNMAQRRLHPPAWLPSSHQNLRHFSDTQSYFGFRGAAWCHRKPGSLKCDGLGLVIIFSYSLTFLILDLDKLLNGFQPLSPSSSTGNMSCYIQPCSFNQQICVVCFVLITVSNVLSQKVK